ncbi:MAG: hypothetical protein ACFB9N_04495 [Geitlerinemataceae cyanobacterium]
MGKQKKKKASLLREMHHLGEAKPKQSPEPSMDRMRSRIPEGTEVITPGPDALKMSKLIQEFVEPYFEQIGDFQQCSSFMPLAIVAWNTAIMPKDKHAREITNFLEVSKPNNDPIEIHGIRQLIQDLIADKIEYYDDFDRMVLDYDFYIAPDGQWRLSVISEPPDYGDGKDEDVVLADEAAILED